MAKSLKPPSTRKTTLGAKFEIVNLAPGVRTPTNYTITVGAAFDSNVEPGYITLKCLTTALFLSTGTQLTFSGITVEIAEDFTINTTNTLVPILDLPLNITIPINSTTSYLYRFLVHGCKSFNISPEIQTTDTSNVSHGAEKEEKQTFNSKKISFEIIEIYNDSGGYLLSELCHNLTFRNQEFWFRYSYPDSSYKQGVALITSVSYNSGLQSTRNFRADARVQPGTYSFYNVF